MKNKNLIFYILFIIFAYNSKAQNNLTNGIQTSNLTLAIGDKLMSRSDINENYYAIAYANSNSIYLKIYDSDTYNLISGPVLVSNVSIDIVGVKIDKANNIYVMHNEGTPGNVDTILSKYNISGTLMLPHKPLFSNNDSTDLEVAPNGDILIGRHQLYNNFLYVNIYDSTNLNLKEYFFIDNLPYPSLPFALSMDMKEDKFVIGYSNGIFGKNYSQIRRYNYIPVIIPFGTSQSRLVSQHTMQGRLAYGSFTQQIAIRKNGEIFCLNEKSTSHPRYSLNKYGLRNSSIENNIHHGRIDVDIRGNLILSDGSLGSRSRLPYKIKLFSSLDVLKHTYTLDSSIRTELSDIAIYDCKFLATGTKHVTKFFDREQAYHQLFICLDCDPDNPHPRAKPKFRCPRGTEMVNSKYGDIEVTELCLLDQLLVDGSKSTCEDRYYVDIAEFDPVNWRDVNVLYSNWVSTTNPAPNNIKITDFLPQGYQLRPGKIYRFRLAVGNPWHSKDIYFKIVCCDDPCLEAVDDDDIQSLTNFKEPITVEKNEGGILIYPNPSKKHITLDFSDTDFSKPIEVQIFNSDSIKMYNKQIKENNHIINMEEWESGYYFCKISIGDKVYTKTIIKN